MGGKCPTQKRQETKILSQDSPPRQIRNQRYPFFFTSIMNFSFFFYNFLEFWFGSLTEKLITRRYGVRWSEEGRRRGEAIASGPGPSWDGSILLPTLRVSFYFLLVFYFWWRKFIWVCLVAERKKWKITQLWDSLVLLACVSWVC